MPVENCAKFITHASKFFWYTKLESINRVVVNLDKLYT